MLSRFKPGLLRPIRAPFFPGVCLGVISDDEARRDFYDRIDVWRAELRNGAADFRYAKLSGIDFTSAVLPGADFHGADLRGSKFVEADLRAADFANASVASSRIKMSVLDGVTFGGDADSKYAHNTNARTVIDSSLMTFAEFRMSNPDNIFTVQFSDVSNSLVSIAAGGLKTDFSVQCGGSLEARLQAYREPRCNEYVCGSSPNWGDAVLERSAACGQQYPRTIDFWSSDLSCSNFRNNQYLELTGSNISSARFPDTYEGGGRKEPYCGIEGSELKYYCTPQADLSADWSPSWIPQQPWADVTWGVWAFEDAPPNGNLFGRTVELRQRDEQK